MSSKKIIVVHIPKTGGTSVSKGLELAGVLKRTPIHTFTDKIIKKYYHKDDLLVTIVRNPWDRALSMFTYYKQLGGGQYLDNNITFEQFCIKLFKENSQVFKNHVQKELLIRPQYDWVIRNNKNPFDHVCKFENLDEEFSKLLQLAKSNNIVPLPHLRKSKTGDYRDYHTETTIEIISECFASDIKEFGYEF